MEKAIIFRTTVFVFITLFLVRCVSSKSDNQQGDISYKDLAEQRIGAPLTYIPNEANDRMLCVNKNTGQGKAPREKIKFLVWDIKQSKVLYESSIDGGKVEWYDDDHLEVFRTPGLVRMDEDMNKYVKIVKVSSGMVISKESFLKSKDL